MARQASHQGYFITGTDTEIGKTYASVSLIKHLCSKGINVAGLKPVASGCELTANGLRNDDALKIANASNVPLDYNRINRYAFEPAIAPHIAAELQGININFDDIESDVTYAKSQADQVVVEAAGGWLVPLNRKQYVSDLALRLNLPVIAVIGIRLGCINHALLTLNQIEQSGADIAGWVANYIDPQTHYANEQVKSIKSRTSLPCIAELPYEIFDKKPYKQPAQSTAIWQLKY